MNVPARPTLLYPHVRSEPVEYLSELETNDPRRLWRLQAQAGLVVGIVEVVYFFIDDHDFDAAAVGEYTFDIDEVRAVESVKVGLQAILDVVGDAGDDGFVSHPLWSDVRRAAAAARRRLVDAV